MYNPYAKGRWYRVFIESDGTTPTLTEDDLGCALSNAYLQMPEDFHVVDVKYDIHSVTTAEVKTNNMAIRLYADGKQAITIAPVTNYDWQYVYVFGYFDK